MYEYLVAFRAGIGICDRLRVVPSGMSITEPTVRPGRGERFAVTPLSASKILWKPFMQSGACTALLPRLVVFHGICCDFDVSAFGRSGQTNKGVWRMTWHQEAMKDVGTCDKPRGAGNRAVILGFLNGATHPSGYHVLNA